MKKTRDRENGLRMARARIRITQRDLATKTGIGVTRVWAIENGYAEPTDDEKKRLARALKTTAAELFQVAADGEVAEARVAS